MRWENIGVNVKKNLWKVFPQPQNPSQACRRSLGSTTRPRQTTLENIQHIGELQILVRQGSFCLKRVQTPAHASGSPRVPLSPQREISACPQTPASLFPGFQHNISCRLRLPRGNASNVWLFLSSRSVKTFRSSSNGPGGRPATVDGNHGVMVLKLP